MWNPLWSFAMLPTQYQWQVKAYSESLRNADDPGGECCWKGKHPKSKSWWWWSLIIGWWWRSSSSSSSSSRESLASNLNNHHKKNSRNSLLNFAKAPIQQPRPRIHAEVYKEPLEPACSNVPRFIGGVEHHHTGWCEVNGFAWILEKQNQLKDWFRICPH